MSTWRPCTHQAHVDELRLCHDDVAAHPSDRGAQDALWEAVGELLNHLDGLHADDVLVELLARGAEPSAETPPPTGHLPGAPAGHLANTSRERGAAPSPSKTNGTGGGGSATAA